MILLDRCNDDAGDILPNKLMSEHDQFLINAIRQEIRTNIDIYRKNPPLNRSDRFIRIFF